jgi:predicted RNase H-like HicB family nuclease
MSVSFPVALDREDDSRWLAEIRDLPGTLCHGRNRDETIARVQALALRVLAERLEHGEAPAELLDVSFRAA